MRSAPLLAGAVLALGIATFTGTASAAPSLPVELMQSETQSLLTEVRHRPWHHRRFGYCARWRNVCADRWGWGGWRYRRCMRRHGC